MKRWAMGLFVAVLAMGAAMQVQVQAQTPPAGVNKSIITAWTPPPGTLCGTTGTKACLLGYTETLTPPAGVPGVDTVAIGQVATFTWSPGGNLYCGTWGISLVANWLDDNGVAAVSAPLTGTVVEPCPFVASPATGLSIKLQ